MYWGRGPASVISQQGPISPMEGGAIAGRSSPETHRLGKMAVILLAAGFCLEASFAELQEWAPTGGPQGGPIRRLVQDLGNPNIVYAIGGRGIGGIWKSSDKGRTWTSLSRRDEDSTGSDFQVDPRNGAVLFKASDRRGVFRSDDSGLTWRDINPTGGNRFFTTILLHPSRPDLLYAVSKGDNTLGVRTSPDGGISWKPPGLRLLVHSIAADPKDPNILYAGTAGGALFRTPDAGESWGQIPFLIGGPINNLVVDPTDSNRILAGTSDGVHVSMNAGNTWSGMGMEEQSIQVIRLAPADPSHVYAATASGVFSSRDGGKTWLSLGLDRSVQDLLVDSENDDYILAGTDRGVFRREDEQVPWTSSNEGLDSAPVMSFAWDPNNPDKIYAGGRGFIARTNDRGGTWANSYLAQEDDTSVAEVTIVTPDPNQQDHLYAGTLQGVLRSHNGGVDWEPANTGLTDLHVRDLKVDPSQPGLVYVAMGESSFSGWVFTSTGGVFRSEDGGESWASSGFDGQYSNCLALDAEGHLYVVSGGLWKSQDNGRSWDRLDVLPQGAPACSRLIIHPERPEVLYIGGINGFFKSEDGGTSWKSSATGLELFHGRNHVFSLALHPEDPETLYAGTAAGVYETRNGGWRWFPIGDGISLFSVDCVGVHPWEKNLIYSCPRQGGLWEYRTVPPTRPDLRYSTFGPLLRNPPDEFTGTALLNLDDVSTSVQLTAYGGNGVPFSGTDVTNPAFLQISPGGQRALLADEIWGPGLLGMEKTGWIRVDASSPRLWGLLAIGKRNLSSLDGTSFDRLGTNDFVFPELTNDGSTLLQIANPNMRTVRATLCLRTADGPLRAPPLSFELPPQGMLSGGLADIFGDIPLEDSDFVEGSATHHVLPLLLIQPDNGDAAVVPALNREEGPKTLYAPQFAVGPGITTEISLINFDLSHRETCLTAAIQVRLFENSGAQIGRHRELFIPCGGKLHLAGEELVKTAQGLFAGYLEVWSTVALKGTVVFRGTSGSPFLAVLPLVGTPEKEQVFAHLAWGTSSFMGLTILNPGEESTQLHLEAFGVDASLLAERSLALAPRERVGQLVSEFFPELADQEIAGGYVRLHSDKGVLAFALFAPWDLSALMTVPSQTLPVQMSPSP